MSVPQSSSSAGGLEGPPPAPAPPPPAAAAQHDPIVAAGGQLGALEVSGGTGRSSGGRGTTSRKQAQERAREKVLRRRVRVGSYGKHEDRWELYPFWSTDPCAIPTLGEGLVLYFRFLKRTLFWLSMACCGAAVLMYLNWTAGDPGDAITGSTSFLFRLSLGNTWLHNADEGPGRVYGIVCAVMFGFAFINIVNMREEWSHLFGRTIRNTAASFSVKLGNLPERVSTRRLAEFLVYHYGSLEALTVITKDGSVSSGVCDHCLLYVNYAHSRHRRGDEPKAAPSMRPVDPLRPVDRGLPDSGKRASMIVDGRHFEVPAVEEVRADPHDGVERTFDTSHFHAVEDHQMVIATFSFSARADECIFQHRRTWLWRLCCCFLRWKRCTGCNCHPPLFYGRRLRCTRPREPSDYLWDNYRVRTRYIRFFFSAVITLGILAGYYLIVRAAHGTRDSIPTEVAFGFGFVLSIFNLIAEFLFLQLTALERHKSRSGREMSMIIKKSIVDFLNNLIVILLVVGTPQPNLSQSPTVSWYLNGGVLISSIILADVVVPSFVRIFHPVHRIKRTLAAWCASSQDRVDEAYVPTLSIYNNFIAFISSMTWVAIYSLVLPVAVPLTIIKMLAMYLLEKYNTLRKYGRPEMIDSRVAQSVLYAAPYSFLLTIAFTALAVRGQSEEIDAIDYTSEEATGAQAIVVPALVCAVAVVVGSRLLGWFFGGVLGIRFCRSSRATRYRATCCWQHERAPYFQRRRETPYREVGEIESYLFSGLRHRHHASSSPVPAS